MSSKLGFFSSPEFVQTHITTGVAYLVAKTRQNLHFWGNFSCNQGVDVWHNFCNYILIGEITLLNFYLCFTVVSIKGDFIGWRKQSEKCLLSSSLSFGRSAGLGAAPRTQRCSAVEGRSQTGQELQQTLWLKNISPKREDFVRYLEISPVSAAGASSQQWKNTALGGRWPGSALGVAPAAWRAFSKVFGAPVPQKGAGVLQNVGRH